MIVKGVCDGQNVFIVEDYRFKVYQLRPEQHWNDYLVIGEGRVVLADKSTWCSNCKWGATPNGDWCHNCNGRGAFCPTCVKNTSHNA